MILKTMGLNILNDLMTWMILGTHIVGNLRMSESIASCLFGPGSPFCIKNLGPGPQGRAGTGGGNTL